MPPIETLILEAAKKGDLLDFIDKEYFKDRNEDKILGKILSRLHNEGKIDLLGEYTSLKRESRDHDFFILRHALEDALPTLNADIQRVTACIKNLIREAGEDMAAHWILGPFEEFCSADPTRPPAVIEFELKSFKLTVELLSTALLSGSKFDLERYTDIAIGLFSNSSLEIARTAIYAVGKMDFSGNMATGEKAFDSILNFCTTKADDQLLATSLRTLVNISLSSSGSTDKLIEFINLNSINHNILFTHSAIEILFREKSVAGTKIESALVDSAKLVRPENTRSIEFLDYYLSNCLNNDNFDKVIDILESIFNNTEFRISIKQFNGLAQGLIRERHDLVSRLITRWLLFRSVGYGRACKELLTLGSDVGEELRFDLAEIRKEESSPHLYLAKKSCGWFFVKPIAVISLTISLIDDCPDEQLNEIANLIFDPLLISYSGSVKNYLIKSKESSDKINKFCNDLLSRLTTYHDGLKSAFTLKELIPIQEHLFLYRKFHQNMMSEIFEEANKKSIFMDLVHKSVLLYGNKSINYIYHGNESTRQEIPLNAISHSIEFPSLENLDPNGLEDKLFRFRIEDCER